jgi:DNA-binding transcriptional LysR family regulator
MDDLRSLRHFVEVARHMRFSEAAAKLSLTNAALSKSIARLEKSLGMRLCTRTTRALHLTSEGQLLFDRLSPSFENIDDTLHEVASIGSEPIGLVSLSTTTGFGKYSVLPLLPEFFAHYPGIDLAISFHESGRGLTRQAFDVRINWGEKPEKDKVAQLLCRLPLILIGSADYLARRGVPKTPEDLTRHECITAMLPNGSRACWVFVKRNARKGSRTPRIKFAPQGRVIVMDEVEAVAHAVRVGLGVAMMSLDVAGDGLRDGSLLRLLPDYEVHSDDVPAPEVFIQYPRRKHLPLRVRVLVDFLMERLRGPGVLESIANNVPSSGLKKGTNKIG